VRLAAARASGRSRHRRGAHRVSWRAQETTRGTSESPRNEMTRKVVRSEAADEDMLAIADDIAASLSIDTALGLDQRLDAALQSRDELSTRGRIIPELRVRGITMYRELIVPPYYRIMYRVEEREVWVIAVLDHRRDLDALLQERARRDRAQ